MTATRPRLSLGAFLSHRYKSPAVNLYFFDLFEEEDAEVQFEVDAGTKALSVTRLERMIRDRDAFIGIYPYPGDPAVRALPEDLLAASRYFRLECDLAVRSGTAGARVPRPALRELHAAAVRAQRGLRRPGSLGPGRLAAPRTVRARVQASSAARCVAEMARAAAGPAQRARSARRHPRPERGASPGSRTTPRTSPAFGARSRGTGSRSPACGGSRGRPGSTSTTSPTSRASIGSSPMSAPRPPRPASPGTCTAASCPPCAW